MPRQVFTAGEILTAANMNDLSDQTVMVFDDSAARGSAIPSPSEGMVTYLKDTDSVEVYDGSAFSSFGGKISQVVTATDTTTRTTTSGTFTDADISVSITPLSATSNLFVTWAGRAYSGRQAGTAELEFQITDSSNAALGGAEAGIVGGFHEPGGGSGDVEVSTTLTGVVASASTSARTYKLRFRRSSGTGTPAIRNASNTGRLIVMEVAG
jgi:hypothetical protein